MHQTIINHKIIKYRVPISLVSFFICLSISGSFLYGKWRENALQITSYTWIGYYVDSLHWNDMNPWTREKPWKTLKKAASMKYGDGDALLLHCRGVWHEEADFSDSFWNGTGRLMSQYGWCRPWQLPIISWSQEIHSEWKRDTTSQYPLMTTRLKTEPTQLFINGKKMTHARFPNSGGIGHEYNTLLDIISQSEVVVREADRISLKWNDIIGSQLSIRSEPWFIDKKFVTQYGEERGIITLNEEGIYPLEWGDGYVLEWKKWMLDSPGEWYYDTKTQQLFVFFPTGITPQNAHIEASVRDRSLILNDVHGVRIEHIQFEQSSWRGIWIEDSSDIVLSNIIWKDDSNSNMIIENWHNIIIDRSTFLNAGSLWILIQWWSNNTIQNSLIKNVWLNQTADNAIAAIETNSPWSLILGNTIENTAYNGIRFWNQEWTKILRNTIKNVCIRLSDCGGIYTWNWENTDNPKYNSLIQENTIIGASVNSDGTTKSIGVGIYLDNLTTHVEVTKNMISDVSVGIFLHEANNIRVDFNTVWKSTRSALLLAWEAERFTQDSFTNNILESSQYAIRENGSIREMKNYSIETSSDTSDIMKLGIAPYFSWNIHLTFHNSDTPTLLSNGREISWKTWNTLWSTDIHVSPIVTQKYQYRILSSPLLKNTMELWDDAWRSFFVDNSPWNVHLDIWNWCHKSCIRFISGNDSDILISEPFEFYSGKTNDYLISYTAHARETPTHGFVTVRRDSDPYESFGYDASIPEIPPYSSIQKEAIFTQTGYGTARIDFYGKIGSEISIENVSLRQVGGVRFFDPYKNSAHLINNTSSKKTFTCKSAWLPNCVARDSYGKKVVWPITLPPYSSRIIISEEEKWKLR